MEGDSIPLPILDGKNYLKWRLKIQSILEAKDLDNVVYGPVEEALRAPKASKASRDKSDDEFDDTSKQKTDSVTSKADKVRGARAKMILINAVDDRHTTIIAPFKSAREMWNRLEQEYSDRQPLHAEGLLTEYYSSKMESSQSPSEYIAYIDSVVDRLKDCKHEIPQAQVMAKIVSSLPPEYNAFRRSWDMLPSNFQTKALLISNIKKESDALKAPENRGDALIARSQPSNKNRNKWKKRSKEDIEEMKRNSKCAICKEKGHWFKECPKRSNQQVDHAHSKPAKKGVNLMASYNIVDDDSVWLLDSGASEHMTSHREWFDTYQPIPDPYPIKIGDGSYLYAVGRGSVKALSLIDGQEIELTLKNVQYVPSIGNNLFSLGAADAAGANVTFSKSKVTMSVNDELIATGSKIAAQLYKLNISVPMQANIARSERTLEEWHDTFGHVNTKDLEEMAKKGVVDGMVIVQQPKKPLVHCGDCQLGKATAASHPVSERPRATRILERIHTDLVGPISPQSSGGASYFILLKDEYSSFMFMDSLANKSDVPQRIIRIVNQIEANSQAKVKIIRSDNGTEFKNARLSDFYATRGIVQEFSAPYTPEQNGEAERANRTIIETARSMIQSSQLPLEMWAEAVNCAVYVRNRTINSRSRGKTPFELFYGRKPDLSHLVPFGQQVHIKDRSRTKSKFDPKTIEAFVVGYGARVNTYRCLEADSREVVITSDVVPASHRPTPSQQPEQKEGSFVIQSYNNTIVNETSHTSSTTCEDNNAIAIDKAVDLPEQLQSSNIDQDQQVVRENTFIDVPTQLERVYSNLDNSVGYEQSVHKPQDAALIEQSAQTAPIQAAPDALNTQNDSSYSAAATENKRVPRPTARQFVSSTDLPNNRDQNRKFQVIGHRGARVAIGTPSTDRNTKFQIDWNKTKPAQNRVSQTQNRPDKPAASQMKQRAASSQPVTQQRQRVPDRREVSPSCSSSMLAPARLLVKSVLPKRTINPPKRFNLSAILINNEPLSFQEAINSADKSAWLQAIQEELAAHKFNGTWEITKLPANTKQITAKWVFKIKDSDNEKCKRFKARLVARGFSQVKGVDYGEIFAPVVRMDSIRLLFSLAAQFELKFVQFDVTTAFLNGFIEEELYMTPPEGLDVPEGYSCKLQRSLYGLKQSPRCWNDRFKSILRSFNMKQSLSDPCVFIAHDGTLYLALYVDDGLIIAQDQSLIDSLLNHLKQELQVKMIESNCFLGLEIVADRAGSIFLHQSKYIAKILERFRMSDCKPVKTPLPSNHPLNQEEVLKTDIVTNIPYAEALGSLMYCAMGTRPDIAYSISVLSKYSSNPRQAHWEAMKRVFRYLKGTSSHGLFYSKISDPQLMCYADADWAGDQDSRKSMNGMVSLINTGAISYKAQQQQVVALSTTEAEYIAGSEGSKEIVWISRFLGELGIELTKKPLLLGDNQGALKLIKNPEFHQRTKHIDIKYHFVREKFEAGIFDIAYVSTDEQKADLFTKSLSVDKHQSLCNMIGCIAST